MCYFKRYSHPCCRQFTSTNTRPPSLGQLHWFLRLSRLKWNMNLILVLRGQSWCWSWDRGPVWRSAQAMRRRDSKTFPNSVTFNLFPSPSQMPWKAFSLYLWVSGSSKSMDMYKGVSIIQQRLTLFAKEAGANFLIAFLLSRLKIRSLNSKLSTYLPKPFWH